MKLFRLDASIRTEGSHSREIADLVEREWLADNPGDTVVRRHLGTDPVPADAWPNAVAAGMTPADQRTAEQQAAVALAAAEVDNMVNADALLFAVPLYNFGVSQHFKTWVDLAITDPRLAAGSTPAIAGKPAVLVTVRGGSYSAGTPREGWDHAEAWLPHGLSYTGLEPKVFITAELTLADVNPALADLRGLAAESLAAD